MEFSAGATEKERSETVPGSLAQTQAGGGEDSFILGQPRSETAELPRPAQAACQGGEGISSGSLPLGRAPGNLLGRF